MTPLPMPDPLDLWRNLRTAVRQWRALDADPTAPQTPSAAGPRGRAAAALRPEDLAFLSPTQAAEVLEPARAALWAVWLMLAAVVAAVAWAALAQVDMITRAPARIVPEGREQVIASLEGGILRELKVREGQAVEAGQALASLDPTRVEAQQGESRARRMSLMGQLARLDAEAAGTALRFPPELASAPAVTRGETASYEARQRALQQAVGMVRANQGLLERELRLASDMAGRGLMSDVEVMRLRRQVNEMSLQVQERINRYRQDAAAELVKVRSELTVLDEQQVVRDDQLKRTVLTSPVRGLVKNIRVNTVGGVVAAGAPVMEIVPVGDTVLVELRIKPADIGFVQIGQPVEIKLSAYDFSVYGSLHGQVQTLSPDALGDPNAPAAQDNSYYRALVRAERHALKAGDRLLTVLPGMMGTAEIRTGERTVLTFLLRPMMKATEAFSER
ncbi:HlyD family type I secretion periplasmic adaptor subunit [Pseudaquabacterium rugosum]|uniref:Membrane fusion protein (MFP) family protein n=1 Tax=Pseudaquabacterium rugosum TaxID=2984194 RepID=A0ABU9B673_9BURK